MKSAPDYGLAVRKARRFLWAESPSLDFEDIVQECVVAAWERGRVPLPDGWARSTIIGKAMHGAAYKLVARLHSPVWMPRGETSPRGELASWLTPVVDAVESELPRLRERVMDALAQLSARDRYIIMARCLGDSSLQDVGDELGLTRERVRQLENRALVKLRAIIGTQREE